MGSFELWHISGIKVFYFAVKGRWMPVEFHSLMKESLEADMRLPEP